MTYDDEAIGRALLYAHSKIDRLESELADLRAERNAAPDTDDGGDDSTTGSEGGDGNGPKKVSEMTDAEKSATVDQLVEEHGPGWRAKWYEMVAAG